LIAPGRTGDRRQDASIIRIAVRNMPRRSTGHAWLEAIPEEMWWLFGTGYLGSNVARRADKRAFLRRLATLSPGEKRGRGQPPAPLKEIPRCDPGAQRARDGRRRDQPTSPFAI